MNALVGRCRKSKAGLPRLCWAGARGLLLTAGLWATGPAQAAEAVETPAAVEAVEAVEGEIIVQLRDGSQISPLLLKHRLTLTGRFGHRDIYRLKVIGTDKVKDKINALRSEWTVRSVEVNATYKMIDYVKNRSWAIGEADAATKMQWAAQAIRLPEAHRITTGRGIRVAILDTGVDRGHPALAGKLLRGFDFVDWDTDPSEAPDPRSPAYGHGTHVAGLVAQVAPGARIMPLRVLDEKGQGNLWVLAEAMLHAVDPDNNPSTDDGAHVINLSLSSLGKTELFKTVAALVSCKKGSLRGSTPLPSGDADDDSDEGVTFSEKVRCGGFGGAVVVVAAGNNASDKIRSYPAAENSSSLLSVGASARDGWLTRFSNYGWVKLAAPGAEIVSSVPGGGSASWSGTSMAAPLVSGAAALLRAADRSLKTDQVVHRLTVSGRKICGTSMRQLDVWAALTDERPSDNDAKNNCKAQAN